MANRRLDTRLMNDKLKRGWCTSDFANYLQCSEEEFWGIFGQLNEDAQIDFRRRLANNENKRKKQTKTRRQKWNAGNRKTAKVPEKEQTVVEETVNEEEMEIMTSEEILEEMKAKESKVQREICNIESEICSLNLQKKEVREELQGVDSELADLQQKVKKLGEKAEHCILKMQQIAEYTENVNQKMKIKKLELEEIRQEIKQMEKTEIFVYKSGEIELIGLVADKFIIEPIWEKVFQKLRDDELVEDLTNRQIKLLSKIIAYIHTNVNCDVTFEVEELQQVFEKIPDKGLSYFFQ